MDINDRVMVPADYKEMLEKIQQMDILAMKDAVSEHFSELGITDEQLETLVKNLFIKQVLVIEDFERRQSEGFTKNEVMEACLEVTANEVLDFINGFVDINGDISEIATAILEQLAPGAKLSEEDLNIPTYVNRPAVISMDDLTGPAAADNLRRVSEQAAINGLMAAGAVPVNVGKAASEAVSATTENKPNIQLIKGEETMKTNILAGCSLETAQAAFQKSCEREIVAKAENEAKASTYGDPVFGILADVCKRIA